MNFAAKPRASEAMTKFMRPDNQKIQKYHHSDRSPAGIEPGQLLAEFAPMRDSHAGGRQNHGSRENAEIGRIEKTRSGNEALQNLARIEYFEPAIQGAATKARRFPVRFAPGSVLPLQEPVLIQVLQEAVQGLHRKFAAKANFHALPNRLERRFSVQLLGDELLNFSHPKELAGYWILDDDRRLVSRLLGADD